MPRSDVRKNSMPASTDTRDPYKILELPVTASAADVRTAYRKWSMTIHPDRPGGDQQAMVDLTWARDLLLDAKAREQYDRLGQVAPGEIDMRDKVLQVVNSIISSVLNGEDDEDTAPVLDKINAWLIDSRKDLAKQLRDARRKLKRARSIARRMKRRAGQGPDLLANVMRGRCELAQKRVEAAQEALEVHVEVIKFFADYTYETDYVPFGAGAPPSGIRRADIDIKWD